MAKRQSSIASTTYVTEFSALRTVIENAIGLCYMLRCLDCNIHAEGQSPTRTYGDNLSVV